MIDELTKRTKELFEGWEGDYTAFDYARAWIENGRTLTALCASISDDLNGGNELGPIQIGRFMLARYLDKIGGESAVDSLMQSRTVGAHAMVETGLEKLDKSKDDRDSINAADKRLQARERLGAIWNAELRQQRSLNVAITHGLLHIDAMRAVKPATATATILPALPALTEGAAIAEDADEQNHSQETDKK